MKGVFSYPAIERVVYGEPVADGLAAEIARLDARRVFLMASRSLLRATGGVTAIAGCLGDRLAAVFSDMSPHTPRDGVLAAAAAARQADADLVVTVGGGSITDAGKMVQLCLRHDIVGLDGFEPFRETTDPGGKTRRPEFAGPDVRQVAVPTTLSGGEFNSGAGCTDPRSGLKQLYRHPLLVPRVVLLDPALTLHTPPWLWMSTGMRAIDHAVEGLCSPDCPPHITIAARGALQLLAASLRRTRTHPQDLDARLAAQIGAWQSLAALQAGVPFGASHAIGHVLGAACGVPHGYTSCVMLPAVLRFNADVDPERQAAVSAALDRPGMSAHQAVAELVAELGLPRTLGEVGVTHERFALIAEHAMLERWIRSNPRPIADPEAVLALLAMAA